VLATVLIVGIPFLIVRYSATPRHHTEVESIELEPLENTILQDEYSANYDFKNGDLVPCDKKNAEHKLDVEVLVNGRLVHQWTVHFCSFNKDNSFVIDKTDLGHSYFCKAGSNGGFSGSQRIVELSESTVTAELNWLCTIGDRNIDIEFPMIFLLGTTAELNIDNHTKIKWDFR